MNTRFCERLVNKHKCKKSITFLVVLAFFFVASFVELEKPLLIHTYCDQGYRIPPADEMFLLTRVFDGKASCWHIKSSLTKQQKQIHAYMKNITVSRSNISNPMISIQTNVAVPEILIDSSCMFFLRLSLVSFLMSVVSLMICGCLGVAVFWVALRLKESSRFGYWHACWKIQLQITTTLLKEAGFL